MVRSETDNRELRLNTTTLIAARIMVTLIGAPAVFVARAKRGSGGGYSSCSWSGGVPGRIGNRGSRTDDQTGTKPTSQLQRSPLPAGFVSWSCRTIDQPYASRSDEQQRADHRCRCACCRNPTNTTEDFSSAGILLLLLLLAAATVFYFLKMQRPSLPDFSGITGRDPSIDNLPNKAVRRNQTENIG